MPHLTYTLPGKGDEAPLAEIALANPPQNRLTAQLIGELGEAVAQIARSEVLSLGRHGGARTPDDIRPLPHRRLRCW
ncbi:hypothetical protein ABZT51_29045 [Streptomyces sp. NPDC005373]|uniref:hypothetical protein n=1 Tax=unclassified Streptomyces TaxID=2593676 RepID=UPI0033B222BF